MKRIISIIAILFVALPLYGVDLSRLTLTRGVQIFKLDNGLTILIKEEHSVPLVGFAVGYKVGFRNEDINGRSGLTHLLEHMMFKGSTKYGKGEIARTLDELGADYNAFTGYDSTVYYEVLPVGGLETAMDLESDRMVNSLFEPAEFESEKMVVYSEISLNQSNPYYMLEDKLYWGTYGAHPLTFMSGTLDAITNATRDYVYNDLYKKYYCPNNAIVVVVGDINTPDALAMVKKYFGALPVNRNLQPERPNPVTFHPGVDVRLEGVASEDFGEILFNLPRYDLNNKDFIALYALSEFGIVADFGYWPTQDFGMGYGEFSDEPDIPAESIDRNYVRAMFDELKGEYFSQQLMSYDSIRSIMFNLYSYQRDGDYRDYDKLMAAMAGVTADDIIRVIDKYLVKSNSSQAFFKAKTRNPNVTPQSSNVTSENFGAEIDFSILENPTPEAISNAAARKAELFEGTLTSLSNYLSTVRTATLPNGITIIYKPFSMTEKVTVSVGFRNTGLIFQRRPYQANTVHSLLFAGGPQVLVQNELEIRGARIWGEVAFESANFNIETMREDFANSVKLIGLALENRTFLPLVLSEEKFNDMNRIRMQQNDPDPNSRALIAGRGLIYGNSGPGMDALATENSVCALAMKDVEDFYRSFYRPENMVIVVVGKINFDEVVAAIKAELGDWTQASATMPAVQATLPTPVREVVKRVPLEVMQDVVIMGAPSVAYTDKTNYTALYLANQIFGGSGLTSRLMRSIRDREGLTYGVYSYQRPYGAESAFLVWMQNNPEQVIRAIDIYKQELARFRETGPTELEILMFQMSTLNSMIFEFETGAKIATSLLNYSIMRGRYDYSIEFLNLIGGFDKEDLMNAVRNYIPENYFITIAGK